MVFFRQKARQYLPPFIKIAVKEFVFGKKFIEGVKISRDANYNMPSLPDTQFDKVEFKKFLIDDLILTDKIHYNQLKKVSVKAKKFFLENFDQNLIVVSFQGQILYYPQYQLNNQNIKIKSNLNSFDIFSILDIEKINDELFITISADYDLNNNCSFLKVVSAKINLEEMEFKYFYENENCLENIQGGRIKKFNHKNKLGFLLTTAASDKEKYLAQKDDSFFGKIIFFELNGNYEIFSKGHRNPQGLYILKNNKILSTEHGPYGGDEINQIIYNKNYGWAEASYGENYGYEEKILKKKDDYIFKKNHQNFGFQEPVFSFVPSIGISEIIKVPDKFSKYWMDNFLIASLNGKSLYRIKFDELFTKVIFMEKIFVGERIRDIKIAPDGKTIFLALESSGSVGKLVSKNSN